MGTADGTKLIAQRPSQKGEFWLSNAIFFVGVHIAACVGIYYRPPWSMPRRTLLLGVVVWQLACLGVTIGYHRLYSHRAFRATVVVRLVLALLGSMAFQGSIKWWYAFTRFTPFFIGDMSLGVSDTGCTIDSPTIRCMIRKTLSIVHCGVLLQARYIWFRYCATRGLLFSHMGWIFFKPKYEKMNTINREDLESDPIVKFQHKFYVPLALLTGFLLPVALGTLWNDPSGAFVWGGLVSRLAIWHCTFLVNSLAHWDGLQPYTDENTSRGNLLLALLTCGEGSHNFHHAFPHDFRAGPAWLNWDPSKWVILILHRFGLVSSLRRARSEDIKVAEAWMRLHGHHTPPQTFSVSGTQTSDESSGSQSSSEMEDEECEWEGPVWDENALKDYVNAKPGRCVVILDGYAIDVTRYLGEHPGGALLLRQYSIRSGHVKLDSKNEVRDLAWETSSAFHGGMNRHSRAARRRQRQLRVARVVMG